MKRDEFQETRDDDAARRHPEQAEDIIESEQIDDAPRSRTSEEDRLLRDEDETRIELPR